MVWFWRFFIYSFWGFVLEVLFARMTRHPKKDRKCLLLLPLCPVYGIGAVLILWLSARWGTGPLRVAFIGFASASAAEYLFDSFCERALGVRFWDYTRMPLNLNGRVCILFSLAWTALSLALVYLVSPGVDRLIAAIPPVLTPPTVILFLCDALISSLALRRTGTTEVLRWYQKSRSTRNSPPQRQR